MDQGSNVGSATRSLSLYVNKPAMMNEYSVCIIDTFERFYAKIDFLACLRPNGRIKTYVVRGI